MKGSAVCAALGMILALPGVRPGSTDINGEVTGVSVLSRSGSAIVVVDVVGAAQVQDFTLANPPRVIVDVLGARLTPDGVRYDGIERAGIRNIRYSQFNSEVVRIVLELDRSRDYALEYAGDQIRLSFGGDGPGVEFEPWSSVTGVRTTRSLANELDPSVAAFAGSRSVSPSVRQQQTQQPRITVTWDSAGIADVMSGFAEFSGKSIILGKDVGGVINARITNQPWDVAFQTIIEAYGLSVIEDPPGIIRIESKEVQAARDSLEPLVTEVIPVQFARSSALQPAVAAILTGRGQVVSDTSSNQLIVIDVERRVEEAKQLVLALDRRTDQVSIKAKIIFVNRTDVEDLGVKYDLGTSDQFFNQLVARPDPSTAIPVDLDGDGVLESLVPQDVFSREVNVVSLGGNALSLLGNASSSLPKSALDLIYSTSIGSFDLTTFVTALQEVELADLQAEPLVTTSDNTSARLLSGERTPIRTIDAGAVSAGGTPVATTSFEETGIKLDVTPHVTNSGQIMLQIHAENSSIRAAPSDLGFTLQTQEAEAHVLVGDGETAVIGGLTVTQITVSKSGIPYLVDLPIVGRLFGFSTRREERRDLLILVTPHIIAAR